MKKKKYLIPSLEVVQLNHAQLLAESPEPESTVDLDFGGEGEPDDNPE